MIRQLIQRIERSEVPLAEEEPQFEAIKGKHSRGQPLSIEEQDLVLKLASKAGEWEKASSLLLVRSRNKPFLVAKTH